MSWDSELRERVLARWPIGASFTLGDVYEFESELAQLHPGNSHVREKIRQALQHLRDASLIVFIDGDGTYRRVAGDLDSGRAFGEVMGFRAGQTFPSRKSVALSGLHRPRQAGISGAAREGADSIVVSGGYEDDEDYGDLIVYTGAGGRDSVTGQQIADQTFTSANQALRVSWRENLPVRVIRGSGGDPQHSPARGFRYDGLFTVTNAWRERGRSGFLVCRFELRRVRSDGSQAALPGELVSADAAPRALRTTERVMRITEVVRRVKRWHGYRCQICGEQIETPAGPYVEGSHIRPLGRPHNGPDTESNVLSLCPNDHVRFDMGAIVINEDLAVIETATGRRIGILTTVTEHVLDPRNLEYHRLTHAG